MMGEKAWNLISAASAARAEAKVDATAVFAVAAAAATVEGEEPPADGPAAAATGESGGDIAAPVFSIISNHSNEVEELEETLVAFGDDDVDVTDGCCAIEKLRDSCGTFGAEATSTDDDKELAVVAADGEWKEPEDAAVVNEVAAAAIAMLRVEESASAAEPEAAIAAALLLLVAAAATPCAEVVVDGSTITYRRDRSNGSAV